MHNNVIEYVPYSPWSLLVCGAVISTQAQRTQMASTDNNDRALLTGCPQKWPANHIQTGKKTNLI